MKFRYTVIGIVVGIAAALIVGLIIATIYVPIDRALVERQHATIAKVVTVIVKILIDFTYIILPALGGIYGYKIGAKKPPSVVIDPSS